MKQSHVRQRLVFLEQLAHMTHGHVRLVFLKLVILELIQQKMGIVDNIAKLKILFLFLLHILGNKLI